MTEEAETITLRFGETEFEAIGIVMGIPDVLDGGVIPHENSIMMAIRMKDWVWSPAANLAINIATGARIPPVDLVKVARRFVPFEQWGEVCMKWSPYLVVGELKYDPINYEKFIFNPHVLARMDML